MEGIKEIDVCFTLFEDTKAGTKEILLMFLLTIYAWRFRLGWVVDFHRNMCKTLHYYLNFESLFSAWVFISENTGSTVVYCVSLTILQKKNA